MDDPVKQVVREGILKVDTGSKIFSISFNDLMGFPGCILTRCIEDVENQHVIIQIERDAEYVDTIVEYIQDEGSTALNRILTADWKFISAILEEAEYFLLDDLAERCKTALDKYGLLEIEVGQVNSEQEACTIHAQAMRSGFGFIFINLLHKEFQIHKYTIYSHVKMLDRETVEVCMLSFPSELYHGIITFKLPQSDSFRSIATLDGFCLPRLFHEFNFGRETNSLE